MALGLGCSTWKDTDSSCLQPNHIGLCFERLSKHLWLNITVITTEAKGCWETQPYKECSIDQYRYFLCPFPSIHAHTGKYINSFTTCDPEVLVLLCPFHCQ